MKRLHPEKIDTPEYYEEIWDKEPVLRKWKFDTVRMVALIRDVKKGDSVADLGAGIYGSAQFIAEHRKNLKCKLTAIDHSHTAKEHVDNLKLPIDYIVSDVDKVPFKDGSFDVVIGGEIIEHQENPESLVREMARVTKPGGWMVISTVNTHCPQAIEHGDYPEHVWEFEPEDLVDLFSPYGKTEYEEVGNYHVIYCNKK